MRKIDNRGTLLYGGVNLGLVDLGHNPQTLEEALGDTLENFPFNERRHGNIVFNTGTGAPVIYLVPWRDSRRIIYAFDKPSPRGQNTVVNLLPTGSSQ